MARRIMIYVQHLLGVGHLKRMALLANDLVKQSAEVMLVSGGFPALHISIDQRVRFIQLPPVRTADASFSGLVDQDGNPPDDSFRGRRVKALLEAFDYFSPDTLVVELFPLGRRQMRFELLPLLQRARPTEIRIVCSVRDIVNQRPKREPEALDWLNRYFDLLLVHGDARLTPISDSVPGIGAFSGTVHHTGYISDVEEVSVSRRSGEILVTAGGGAAGEALFDAAAGASRLHDGPEIWRIRHGMQVSPAKVGAWRKQAHPAAVFEPVAPDFREKLHAAALSISQFGYNTATDLMHAGTRCLIVPYEGAGETEQTRRAEAFHETGIAVLPESGLSTGHLAGAVRQALRSPAPDFGNVKLNGLATSTRILMGGQN
ncbi:glycosyltransferase family protein [Minwuia sp.]|uniref:glycosyltransferase family protein n=1 Tax=Minwuia sp. TaxID=2493630 RepID=UPI003A90DFAC